MKQLCIRHWKVIWTCVCVCVCVRVHNQGLHCSWLLGKLTPHFFQTFIDHSIYRSSFLIWNTQSQKWFPMCSFLNFREILQWIFWMNVIFPESRWLVFPNKDIFIYFETYWIFAICEIIKPIRNVNQFRFSTIWVQFWRQMSCKTFPFRAFLGPELCWWIHPAFPGSTPQAAPCGLPRSLVSVAEFLGLSWSLLALHFQLLWVAVTFQETQGSMYLGESAFSLEEFSKWTF